MATYVIGDIHGCFETLQALWRQLNIDLRHDRLWLVGDLVNRGPRSLDVLRWAKNLNAELGERMQVVLGNHDLHLLARYDGHAPRRAKDTLEEVLAAPDRDELLAWLAARPLLYRQGETVLVHAGLDPRWTPEEAESLARDVALVLRDPERRRPLIDRSFAVESRRGTARTLRFEQSAVLAALTGLRTCDASGEPCKFKGPPEEAPAGCLPWFEVPGRRSAGATVVFGHWAALGLRIASGAIALDSGCVWGNRLSAIRLEDRVVFQQRALDA